MKSYFIFLSILISSNLFATCGTVSFATDTTNLKYRSTEVISPVDFAKSTSETGTIPVKTNFSSLSIAKEIIHTLKPGETVAFTNEYQLGLELADDQYYIYLKRGEDYYVKTAKSLLGPYDVLNTALPDASRQNDLIFKFHATKNEQNYFIIQGKEYGPYPVGSNISHDPSTRKTTISFEDELGYYLEYNSEIFGPYDGRVWAFFFDDEMILNVWKKDTTNLYFQDKKIHEQMANCLIDVRWKNHLIYSYRKEGKYYIKFDEKTYGPYNEITKVRVAKDKIYFQFKKDDEVYAFADGTEFGPYEYITFTSDTSANFYYCLNGKYYEGVSGKMLSPENGVVYGMLYSEINNCYQIVSKNVNQWYVHLNGISYGPFAAMPQCGFGELINCAPNSLPYFIGKVGDYEYWIMFNNQKIGPFKNEPRLLYSAEKKTLAVITVEYNWQGGNHYLQTEDKKIGPFKEIKPHWDEGNHKFKMAEYNIIAEGWDGKKYLLKDGEMMGPFDEIIYDKYYAGSSFAVNENGKWYYLTGEIWTGPFELLKDSLHPQIRFECDSYGNLIQSIETYYHETTFSGINSKKFDGEYYIVYSNENNFFAERIIRPRGESGFILNDELYTAEDYLAYSFHETTKTLYWLTLDGKNIVRNSVKL